MVPNSCTEHCMALCMAVSLGFALIVFFCFQIHNLTKAEVQFVSVYHYYRIKQTEIIMNKCDGLQLDKLL